MLSSIPAKTYYISDPAINVSIPLYTLSPGTCPYELFYSATLLDNSLLPAPITLQGVDSSSYLKLYSLDPSHIGFYQVKIKVTDPKTGIVNSSLIADITILCFKTIAVSTNPIPDNNTYTINISVLKTMSLNLPTFIPSPSNC